MNKGFPFFAQARMTFSVPWILVVSDLNGCSRICLTPRAAPKWIHPAEFSIERLMRSASKILPWTNSNESEFFALAKLREQPR